MTTTKEPSSSTSSTPSNGNGKGPGNGAGNGNQAALGFEKKLWDAADLLRNNVDPSEYKHVVLGLLFLKYISDAFEERRAVLREKVADPEDPFYVEHPESREEELAFLLDERDSYTMANIFWVPDEVRWERLRARAKQDDIGKVLDGAMDSIEAENPSLKGVLPRVYARPSLDRDSLGKLIDMVSTLQVGNREARARDVLGRVYEYFLGRFASAEGKGGGEFYTPESVVRLLVEMIEPFRGRVYDPCCGSGGMFVQSLRFLEAHDGRRDQVSIYGQESNYTTWRLARMNLAIRGIEADLGERAADTFRSDLHPDLKADYILANPPFNVSEWHADQLTEDVRFSEKKYGMPPAGNANFAWVLHMVHHLAPTGVAGFVLANGSMSSMQGGEGEIREALVRDDLVDCLVALPPQLFYQTQIPVCLWFLARGRDGRGGGGAHRDRRGEVLFLDARKLGEMESRTHRVLTEENLERITGAYHAWRDRDGTHEDVPGFSKAATLEEIEAHDFVLTPGRYVGIDRSEDEEGEPFEVRMERLVGEYGRSKSKSVLLDREIADALETLVYELS